jgi:putative transcriptional regulator
MNRSKLIAGRIVQGLDQLASALKKGEKLSEQFTCRKVVLDLHPIPYSPKAVKATRKLLRTSQAVFAQFLGVKPATVQSWEQGRQIPGDMACRFLDEIQRNPEYWRARLRESIKVKTGC